MFLCVLESLEKARTHSQGNISFQNQGRGRGVTSRQSLIVGMDNPVYHVTVSAIQSMIVETTRMNPGKRVDRRGSVE